MSHSPSTAREEAFGLLQTRGSAAGGLTILNERHEGIDTRNRKEANGGKYNNYIEIQHSNNSLLNRSLELLHSAAANPQTHSATNKF